MPIAPRNPFVKFTCTACGWSIVSYQTSDAMHGPHACPKCEGTQLALSKANALESMQAFPKEFFLRMIK